MRLQLALNVEDLEAAVAFYSRMFGAAPHKRRPGYANFALEEPPLKLVLFEQPGTRQQLNHLGVEVFDEAAVAEAGARLSAAGLPRRTERDTTCCHARANKEWTRAPGGLRWEWYRITDDAPAADAAPRATATDAAECAPGPQARDCCGSPSG
ncbi:MAG: VOC family protein [Deltaproteobacteria bacterium]|nr:VOC family protein [Deltaproteobacteria bacterium]